MFKVFIPNNTKRVAYKQDLKVEVPAVGPSVYIVVTAPDSRGILSLSVTVRTEHGSTAAVSVTVSTTVTADASTLSVTVSVLVKVVLDGGRNVVIKKLVMVGVGKTVKDGTLVTNKVPPHAPL